MVYTYDGTNDTMAEAAGEHFSPYPRTNILVDINGSGDKEVIMLRRDNNPRLLMRNYGTDPVITFEQDLNQHYGFSNQRLIKQICVDFKEMKPILILFKRYLHNQRMNEPFYGIFYFFLKKIKNFRGSIFLSFNNVDIFLFEDTRIYCYIPAAFLSQEIIEALSLVWPHLDQHCHL